MLMDANAYMQTVSYLKERALGKEPIFNSFDQDLHELIEAMQFCLEMALHGLDWCRSCEWAILHQFLSLELTIYYRYLASSGIPQGEDWPDTMGQARICLERIDGAE